jgi:hypothetical protein
MKTTTIDMSKVKGKNVFEGVKWSKTTAKEASEAFLAISKVKGSRKRVA